MKKRLHAFLAVTGIALLLAGAFSCSGSDDVVVSTGIVSVATGKISGTARFSNVGESANGGIMVTLDRTDGLRTVAVARSENTRSAVDSARAVVANTVTASDGTYSFSNLEPGTYTVYAASSYSAERAVCTNVVVRASETTVADSLKLTATGSITGTITTDESATGNTGFLVFVAGTSFMAMTDDTGKYTISGVPAGEGYQVVATKNGVIHNLSSNVTVVANGSATMAKNNFTTTELTAGVKGDQGEKGEDGRDGTDGISIEWLGAFASASEIENPRYLNAYFNTTDGCSYIYTRAGDWTLLARSGANGADGKDGKDGADGVSIVWKGESASAPADPALYWAYYNTTDGCSYIWNGTKWDLLSKDGLNGANGTNGKDGVDGVSIVWKGESASAPAAPALNWAYYNTTDGCSYIWNGTKWDLLSKAGANGADGTNGTNGKDGASVVWLGSFAAASEIANPAVLNAYYNTTDGCSYIYNGTAWELLAKAGADGLKGNDGTNGTNGKDGKDGAGITWLGSFADTTDIENPAKLNAYYNTTDGCSYIYNGTAWELLAKAGADGSGSGTTQGGFFMATELSTESLTNDDVTITVSLTKTDMAKVGYVYTASAPSFANAREVLDSADFVALTKNANGKYVVTAAVNGWYTIAAKDTDGFTAFIGETIDYIDKTAPAAVSGLTAKYRANTKKLTVSWVNPTDSDFDYASLSYTKAGTAVVTDCHATSPYVLSDVEVDGDEYVFSVKAVDKAGNESVVQTASVTPGIVAVQGITLSRYHFAYNDADQTVTAVAALSSADQIEEGTVVTIQTKDPSGNVTNTVATLDKEAGTATATITAPATSSSNSGTTYTVLCKIGDDEADATHTARFNVSAGAYLTGLSQSLTGSGFVTGRVQISLGSVTSSTTEYVRIEGYNLDLTAPYIQLYDSTGAAYYTNPIAVDTSAVAWTATTGSNSQTIDTEIPVPTTDDSYTVMVLFGDKAQTSYTRTLQVYDVPKFTSFTIPLVSVAKEDNTVTATIVGKYFDTPDTDLSNFTATCASKPSVVASTSFTRTSDTVLTATFTIPGTVGEYDITVRYGTNSITGTLKVQDFSAYSVGDVLLNDGTIVRYDADNLAFTDGQKQKAVSVLAYFNDYGAPVGLGIYNSYGGTNSGYYKWAPIDTTGYNTMFTGIICTPSETDSGAADTATFTGDTDGSDNWAYICSVDPAGTADAATNYPAFNYVNNYASTFGLTGDYADGWYMPSIAELCYIYRSKAVLNAVLSALGGIQLYTEYWPSSQSNSDKYAWNVNFYSGYVGDSLKRADHYVCCVRAFN